MLRRGATLLAATITALATMVGVVAAKPTYGVVPQDGALPSSSDLELMPRAGIKSVRLIASWAAAESEPGAYNWGAMDAMVRKSTARGIRPLFFFFGTPAWAAHRDGHQCHGGGCSVFAPRTPATQAAFARFAGAAAARYGAGGEFWEPASGPGSKAPCGCSTPRPITAWQVWNEQNSAKYFAPQVQVSDYAALLRQTSSAIKAADPSAEVILGGMWGPRSSRKGVLTVKAYLKRLYGVAGIQDSFDAIALHPYAPTSRQSVDQVESVRRLVKSFGDPDVGLWVTELGWAAAGPKGHPYVKGRHGQARLLSRTLRTLERRARSFRLEAVFWYSWRDKNGGSAICDWCGHAGLRAKNGSAKPAWRAFARVARS